jgi:hypothetical protein
MRQPSPLTARHCADFMGFTTEWIRRAISEGVMVRGRVVKLEAERLELDRRTHYRIHEDSFIAFLQAIGWKHLPRRTDIAAAEQAIDQQFDTAAPTLRRARG